MSVSGIDYAATVEALTKSLNLVPSSAVPAIVDCVLASSTDLSPSRLFYLLLDAFPKLHKNLHTEEPEVTNIEDLGYIISLITALVYIIKNFGLEPDALESFIYRLFVPLLKTINHNDSELLNQVTELLCDVVAETQTWESMEATLVPYSLSSLRLSFGKLQNGECAIYQWGLNDKICGPDLHQEATLPISYSLPLFVACHILSSLLSGALCTHQAEPSSVDTKVARKHGSPGSFVKHMLWDLSSMTVCMLLQCSELRSYAIRVLLPSIFRAFDVFSSFEVSLFEKTSVLSREYFSREVWNCCKCLFSFGPLERLDAFLVLSLSLYSFFPIEKCENLDLSNDAEEFDIRAEKEFWEKIRMGLVDKEGLVRKQSLHILRVTLGSYSSLRSDKSQRNTTVSETDVAHTNGLLILHDESLTPLNMTRRDKWAAKEARSLGVGQICNSRHPSSSGQQRWEAFLLLYEMLEEYGAHLVEAAWVHQVSLLLSFSSSDSYAGSPLYQIQMETLEGIFTWLSVLWERGICHGNPQVRCLIMQSFLSTNWKNHGNCAKLVPESFILGPFVQGLNDPVHHKNFDGFGNYY